MFIKSIFNFIQVVVISIMLAGCNSFTCDELSDENEIVPKSDLSSV